MSDAAQIELIRNLPAILTAVGVIAGAVCSYLGMRRSTAALEQSKANHQQLNGFLAQRDIANATASEAVGNLAGRAEQVAEDKAKGS